MRPWMKAALAGLAVVAAFATGFLLGGGEEGASSDDSESTLGATQALEAAKVSTGKYEGDVAVAELATTETTTDVVPATTTTPTVTTTPTPAPSPAPTEPTPETPPVIEK